MVFLEVDVYNKEFFGKLFFIDLSEMLELIKVYVLGVIFGCIYLWWVVVLGMLFLVLFILGFVLIWFFIKGVGIWGVNVFVVWGFVIINFVWWIGIGYVGILIFVIFFLLWQEW